MATDCGDTRLKKGQKRCKSCQEPFTPRHSTLEQVCSVPCSIAWAQTEEGRAYYLKDRRLDTRERKQAAKTAKDHKKAAKKELHRYIRLRDKDLPCISCGNPNPKQSYTGGQWDAGHYRSVGSCIELEFEPLNIAKQCKRCNAGNRLSGNTPGFRKGLIERIGIETVEWLDGPHPMTHYRADDYKAIGAQYKKMARELELGEKK